MALTDIRKTVLQIINEVRNKLGLQDAASLTADSQVKSALNYLNDVVDITSDYGDWQETLNTVLVTASSSVMQYVVSAASAVIKNIHEVAFQGQIAPLRLKTIDELRRWQRTGGIGNPINWTIMGVDSTTGNPIISTYPIPGPNENNKTFNILYYEKPRLYTTSDASVIPPFPSRLLVSGLLAMMLLDESRGTQNIDFMTEFMKVYEPMLEEAFNRYNGDSGSDILYKPQMMGYRRR
jgi:hypothetical protein